LVGNEKLLLDALQAGASGCITAMANLFSPSLRMIWDGYQRGEDVAGIQSSITAKRNILDQYTPFPPSVKALVSRIHGFPLWPVKLPLSPLSQDKIEKAYHEMVAGS